MDKKDCLKRVWLNNIFVINLHEEYAKYTGPAIMVSNEALQIYNCKIASVFKTDSLYILSHCKDKTLVLYRDEETREYNMWLSNNGFHSICSAITFILKKFKINE